MIFNTPLTVSATLDKFFVMNMTVINLLFNQLPRWAVPLICTTLLSSQSLLLESIVMRLYTKFLIFANRIFRRFVNRLQKLIGLLCFISIILMTVFVTFMKNFTRRCLLSLCHMYELHRLQNLGSLLLSFT